MFFKCKTVEEVKNLYRKLALRLHPDHGGCPMLFNLLQDAKDDRVSVLASVGDEKPSEGLKMSSEKYENRSEDVYDGDSALEIMQDFRKYKEKSPKFNVQFLESLEEFLEEKGYLTSSQYNCLVKAYYAFRMWEKI